MNAFNKLKREVLKTMGVKLSAWKTRGDDCSPGTDHRALNFEAKNQRRFQNYK